MVSEFGFQKKQVPLSKAVGNSQSVSIFVTSDYLVNDKVIVIFTNSFVGVWSRSALLDGDEESGSMIRFIRRARSYGYAVIITNFLDCVDSAKLSGSIPCHEAVDNHIKIIWDDYVMANPKSDLFLFAYSKGGQYLKRCLQVRRIHRFKWQFSSCSHHVGHASGA